MKWKVDKDVISELNFNGENIIFPWGVETADSSAFFSLERDVGYRYSLLNETTHCSDDHHYRKIHVQMKEGRWVLDLDEKIVDEKTIDRQVKLHAKEKSYLMDFVLRYRFKKEYFQHALIDGRKILHRDTNIYYQYPVSQAALIGHDFNINFEVLDVETSNKFIPNIYVRDYKDEWIVHVRMMPVNSDKDVIKLCSRYFQTRPLPKLLTKGILKSNRLREFLWYKSEKGAYKTKIGRFFSPNAFALSQLNPDEIISWKVRMTVG